MSQNTAGLSQESFDDYKSQDYQDRSQDFGNPYMSGHFSWTPIEVEGIKLLIIEGNEIEWLQPSPVHSSYQHSLEKLME